MVVALVSGACNRADNTVDRQAVKQETREAAGKAKEAAGKAGEKIADGWLVTKIQAQFFADQDIRARDISVSAHDGVVVLRGRVQDENAHLQAVQTAHNTDGVRQVTDELAVGPETPAASAPATGGAVATTGERTSEVAARAAALLDDARITSTIQSKYFLDETVKGRHIDVDASHSVVTLHGEVASDAERAQALRLARNTDGVQRVEDALSVNPALASSASAPPASPPAEGSPTVGQRVDDATITTKIQAKYFLDRDVKVGGMDVTTKDGVVMLEGTVATQAAKDRAIELARETEGVIQVVDRLQVRTAERPAPKRPAATKSRAH
jgi:osmotically-inducible protein OsmY